MDPGSSLRLAHLSLDRLAMSLSAVCVVHCLATTVALVTFASLGGVLVHPIIHEIGLGLAIALGLMAFGRGYGIHHRGLPIVIGGLGLIGMAYALSTRHGTAGEILFTIGGVSLVALGHALNQSAIRRSFPK